MTAPILGLCDAVANAIRQEFENTGDLEVSREYITPIKVESLVGRKCYVFPAEYSASPAARGEDLHERSLAILVIERYPNAGPVPDEWLDEQVNFVHEIWLMLTNPRSASIYGSVWPQMANVLVYDVDELSRNKLFWSELEITFQEVSP